MANIVSKDRGDTGITLSEDKEAAPETWQSGPCPEDLGLQQGRRRNWLVLKRKQSKTKNKVQTYAVST